MADADMQTLSQQMQELERSNQELIAKLERLRTGEPDERDTPSAAAKIKEALAAAAYSEAEQSASKSASKGASKGAFSHSAREHTGAGIFILAGSLARSGGLGSALAGHPSKKWARLDRTRKVYACYIICAPNAS